MAELVYINGDLVPKTEAKISVFDHGFLYGNGLFETMRAYHRKVFRLEHHLQRLFLALEYLRFPIPFSFDFLKEAVYNILDANRVDEAYVRVSVTRGEGATVPDPSTCGVPNLIIITREYVSYSPALYQKGYRGKIVSVRPSPHTPTLTMKTLNYLNNIIAKREAKDAGFNEALMINTEGFVTEGAVSSLFMIKGGLISTPAREVGLLPGITRQVILEIAEAKSLKAREAKITPSELLAADEAFLTNSLIEIMPLVEIDGYPLGRGSPSPLTQELMGAYRELVKTELRL